jgi:hypothetical protein
VFAAAQDVTNQNQAHIEIARQQATALDRLAELEQFHRLAVGRELKIIELKKENEYLRKFGLGEARRRLLCCYGLLSGSQSSLPVEASPARLTLS